MEFNTTLYCFKVAFFCVFLSENNLPGCKLSIQCDSGETYVLIFATKVLVKFFELLSLTAGSLFNVHSEFWVTGIPIVRSVRGRVHEFLGVLNILASKIAMQKNRFSFT